MDTDPDLWMPMTLAHDDYCNVMTSKGVDAADSSAHHGRMQVPPLPPPAHTYTYGTSDRQVSWASPRAGAGISCVLVPVLVLVQSGGGGCGGGGRGRARARAGNPTRARWAQGFLERFGAGGALPGLGRIVALYCRLSTS
jgi:hypothetical protein